MRRNWLGVLLAAIVLGAGTVAFLACGNNANDVAGCRYLEDLRCDRAFECGLDPNFPLHAGSSAGEAVTACKLFYEDACLHGFATTIDISLADTTNCAAAIVNEGCNIVINPQLAPGCSWLVPIDAGIDAPDAYVADAGEVDSYVAPIDAPIDTGETCLEACQDMCVDDQTCVGTCEANCTGQ